MIGITTTVQRSSDGPSQGNKTDLKRGGGGREGGRKEGGEGGRERERKEGRKKT